jgi:phosphomannomutase
VRPSNTTPVLVLRFEGETPEALERIKARFRDWIHRVDPGLELPF